MDIDQLKSILHKYNLKPNFTYGQNFLVDDLVMEDILDTAAVSPEDCVLEIGPGIGSMTRKLCQRAKLVLSIEKDPAMLPVLKSIKKDFKNFRFEIADALEYDFQKFFRDAGCLNYKVVANIPYYITGKILRMLFATEFKPESVTLLVQKEVARNVAAKAGDLSLLAISVQLYGDPEIVQVVPARSFFPAPKVDSAVLKIDVRKKPKYEIGDEKKFFSVLRACFAGKRKQLHNTLKNNLKLSAEQADKILRSAKINPAARPQELTITQWIELADKIKM